MLWLIPVFFVLFFGVIVLFVIVSVNQSAKRKSYLGELAEYLEGPSGSNIAYGRRNGVEVSFALTSRRRGSDRVSWTEVDAEIPAAYPLAIHLRKSGFGGGGFGGKLVDVKVGDSAFDAAFVIEAAPADVVVKLFDARAREFLSGLPFDRIELDTVEASGKAKLRFSTRGWIEDVAVAKAVLDEVSRIASRVRTAYADADATAERAAGSDGGSPYRPERDASADEDRAARRAAEVADVKANREARAKQWRNVVIAIFLVSVGLMGLWFYSEVKRMGG